MFIVADMCLIFEVGEMKEPRAKCRNFRNPCEISQHKEIFATSKKFRNCAKFRNRTIAGVRSEPAEEDKNSNSVSQKKKNFFFSL